MKKIFCFLCLWLSVLSADFIHPPASLPVKVETNFYLLGVHTLVEQDNSFSAEAHFNFRWHDERLSHKGESLIYLGKLADKHLKAIWSPQIMFLNEASHVHIGPNYLSRQVLVIYPDGTVDYGFDVSGSFYTHYDFHRFPFDHQVLPFKVTSAFWDDTVCQFVPAHNQNFASSAVKKIMDTLIVLNIEQKAETNELVNANPLSGLLANDLSPYSTFVASVHIEREWLFYLLQVFFPILLVFMISCVIFVARTDSDFIYHIWLLLECILVFVATKFVIDQDMPKISYMTTIDKTFLSSYAFLTLSIILLLIRHRYHLKNHKEKADAVNRFGLWFIPTAFLITFLIIVL